LVFHEIGVVAFEAGWREVWCYSKDIIVGSEASTDALGLRFMDAPPVKLRLCDGKVLSSGE
jgi:hypothetical protein